MLIKTNWCHVLDIRNSPRTSRKRKKSLTNATLFRFERINGTERCFRNFFVEILFLFFHGVWARIPSSICCFGSLLIEMRRKNKKWY